VILGVALGGAVLAIVLWTVGLVTTLPPNWFRALFLAALVSGPVAAVAAWRTAAVTHATRSAAYRIGGVSFVATVCFAAGVLLFPTRKASLIRGAEPVEVAPKRIRIVDLNVLHGYPDLRDQEQRSRDLLAGLRALDPGVIVLQEASINAKNGNLAQRLGTELRMDVAYARANGSRRLIGFEEGSAILSRFPIIEARRIPLSPRKPLWESRIALIVTVALGSGNHLTIVGTHFAHGAVDVAALQARDLLRYVPNAGFRIIAGDFNAPSGTEAVTLFTSHGFTDVVPGGIDHVLVPESVSPWRVDRASWTLRPDDMATLIGRRATISDHPGILVDLIRGERRAGP
jgi:endonuclease/exonuclease/phosphatase family metal-dependent hydrolase